MAESFFKAGGTAEQRINRMFRPGISLIIPGLFLCADEIYC